MRKIRVKRTTKETNISCDINLDGTGTSSIKTGIGFFDHMLEIFSHHSLIDLQLEAVGDKHVDFHHTIEDTGYVIAEAITKALSDKKGIRRYGFFYVRQDLIDVENSGNQLKTGDYLVISVRLQNNAN